RKIPAVSGGQSHAAKGISRCSHHAGGRVRRCRHGGVEWFIRASSNTETGVGSAMCGGNQMAEVARGSWKVWQTELQYRTVQVARRCKVLARRRNEALANNHQRRENRRLAVASAASTKL